MPAAMIAIGIIKKPYSTGRTNPQKTAPKPPIKKAPSTPTLNAPDLKQIAVATAVNNSGVEADKVAAIRRDDPNDSEISIE